MQLLAQQQTSLAAIAWSVQQAAFVQTTHVSISIWKDKVRNEAIRDNTGQDMLEVIVRKRRLRWFGHVQRMEDSRRGKQALEWIPDEKKKRGRPRITWRDRVWTRYVECMNMTWEDVCHEATDRKEWKEWTARCAPSTGTTKV